MHEQFTEQKRRRLPAWAIVLITLGTTFFLGLCCLFSLFTFAQDFRDEIFLEIGELVIAQTYSQSPEEAMERVRPSIRIDSDVLEVIVGEYETLERYSGDLFSDYGEYFTFTLEKSYIFTYREPEGNLQGEGIFSAQRITFDELFELTSELDRETMLFLDERVDTDWYHISLYAASFSPDLGYEAHPSSDMFMSIADEGDIIFYEPRFSLTSVARTVR